MNFVMAQTEYRRKSEKLVDPRLSRRDTKTSSSVTSAEHSEFKTSVSPKNSSKSPSIDSHIGKPDWQTSQIQPPVQYSSGMQTAYQHLQPNMYTTPNQYPTQGYSASYSSYQTGYTSQSNTYDPYQDYQEQTGYRSGSIQPGPPGEEYPHNEWAPAAGYRELTQQQVLHSQLVAESDTKKDAVALELKQQKAQMSKQREDYVRKVIVLRRELELLRNQKQELLSQHSSEHDNNHIMKENHKLQVEIQTKMKTIYNVIEMLTNIIGDSMTATELEEIYMEDSPKRRKEKSQRSVSKEEGGSGTKFFYIYYDPELHWCRICDVFPKSAKEYLLHLHSNEHRQITQERDMVDTPWHRLSPEAELPSFEGAPRKRMPIKGLQFLISATSWYCKLCDTWVGDLHCASQHLKSLNHNQNYANFVEQNPHWEIEWIRDRDKALQRIKKNKNSGSEEFPHGHFDKTDKNKKRKERYSPVENKKKIVKKKSLKRPRNDSTESSSSSSSYESSSEDEKNDTSKSIRVSMRNKMKLQAQMIMNEDLGGKWEVLGRLVEERKRKEAQQNNEAPTEDKLINQWMTVNEPQEKDKHLLYNLKDGMKQKQEAEKAKLMELEQKQKEKEKQEQELRAKKEREEKELHEKEEAKRLQLEETERLRNKEREQIRFKTKEKVKKRSVSRSPERSRTRYSRSPVRSRRDRSSDHYRRDNRYRDSDRRSPDRRRRSTSRDSRHGSRDRDHYKSESRDRKDSSKKPHFIGRMPLFKNKKQEEKVDTKEIKKEEYDIPRQSRFQPGNLAKSFIPEPDVVCFPKLSSIPPLTLPPPVVALPPVAPEMLSMPDDALDAASPDVPVIATDTVSAESEELDITMNENVVPPPPPPLDTMKDDDDGLQPEHMMSPDFSVVYTDPSMMDPTLMMQYQYNMDYNSMMYSHMYDYQQESDVPAPPEDAPLEPDIPAPPPPLPPDDPNDLALLGISADDMAAQIF